MKVQVSLLEIVVGLPLFFASANLIARIFPPRPLNQWDVALYFVGVITMCIVVGASIFKRVRLNPGWLTAAVVLILLIAIWVVTSVQSGSD